MKTTLELPDALFRKAKATAAARGQSMKDYVTEALREKLGSRPALASSADPAWMAGFGELATLRKETARVQAAIDEAFEVVEPEDRK